MPARTLRLIKENVKTSARNQMMDITSRIAKYIMQNNVLEGFVNVFIPHTTAGITIQENADPDVQHDLLAKLEALVPHKESYYKHAEGNSDSHLKASMMGSSVTVQVENGRLQLGRWQGIYLMEFDGPRDREVWIRVVDLGNISGMN
jgi:secondary thiamine-phosphate synthase enzyme